MQAATTSVTAVDGFGLECNGAAASRATYSALNTKLSGLSYPFGTGDGSTTMNVPDLRARTPYMVGSSGAASTVNGLGDNDGVTHNSRTPQHTHSVSITSGAGGSHTHTLSSGTVTPPATYSDTSYNGGDPSITSQRGGSFTLSGSTGAEASHTHSVSGTSGSFTGSYQVVGILIVKY